MLVEYHPSSARDQSRIHQFGKKEGLVEEFKISSSVAELVVIDGEAIEFEWTIFLALIREIQNGMQKQNAEPEKFADRIIFMSMFNNIDWARKGNDEKCVSNSEHIKMYGKRCFRRDTGRSLGLEMKRSGMEIAITNLKESGIPSVLRWYNISRRQVTQFLQVPVLKIADSSNTELLLKIIHSVYQLCVYGAVANWCDQVGPTEDEREHEHSIAKEAINTGILKSVNPQEKNSWCPLQELKSRLETDCEENLRNFESLSEENQFPMLCELALFWKSVEGGMCYRTNGFGGVTLVYREYTLSRKNPHARIYAATHGGTIIGPVIRNHGLEIAISSPRDRERTSWVLLSRGRNRFVEKLHTANLSHVPSSEFLCEQAISKETEPCVLTVNRSRKLGAISNCARKSEANPVSLTAEPVYFTKATISHPCLSTYKGTTLSTAISKMVTKFVPQFDQDEPQTNAAVH